MLILADTSIWVDHIRKEDPWFGELLGDGSVAIHPFIIGELALGHVPDFDNLMSDLRDLPQAPVASSEEVLQLIQHGNLSGSGIGYVDAHLLASVAKMSETRILTRDRRLHDAAKRLSIAVER